MHFSKNNSLLIDSKIKEKLEFGTLLHSYLEYIDFNNIDLSLIDTKYKSLFQNLFNNKLFQNINNSLNIYKEYEFIYYDKDTKLHGIIDLMIEYENNIDIIDYKLKNIYDTDYIKQLTGYRDYIKTKTSKEVNIYLYSIIDNKYISL